MIYPVFLEDKMVGYLKRQFVDANSSSICIIQMDEGVPFNKNININLADSPVIKTRYFDVSRMSRRFANFELQAARGRVEEYVRNTLDTPPGVPLEEVRHSEFDEIVFSFQAIRLKDVDEYEFIYDLDEFSEL